MKIALGNDHHGVDLKNEVINYLKSKSIEYIDCGSNNEENVDYIDSALKVCNNINNKICDLGILICGTGIGMSIVANKIKGIYCAKVNNEKEAALCREHNRANVIAVGENIQNLNNVIQAFINGVPSEEERHKRRMKRIVEIEGELK